MKKAKKILVSGGSIAGLTLAYWLVKYGFEVILIERAEALRLGGQNIDVKGPGWEIVQKMGLDEKIKAATTTEVGIRFVDSDNQVVAEFPKDSAVSMTQEIEILRGDLVNILYEPIKDQVKFRFGTTIKKLSDQAVTFHDGTSEPFDLVIIAEGIGSTTRQLVFGREIKFNYLGLYGTYLTMKKVPTDTRWARWCNAVGGVVFMVRPDNHGTTRGSVFFRSPERGYEKLAVAEQKELLIKKIRDAGWEANRFIKEIQKTDDLYFERVSQVKAPRWHKGNVVLTGDAAWCPTPITGQGVDLAITGAYVLAGELSRNADHESAFKAYEQLMRPYVEKVQKVPPGVPGLVYPTSKFGIGVLNFFFGVAASKPAQFLIGLFGKKKTPEKPGIDLPDYNSRSAHHGQA